ncbi:MAG: hypothetical protein AB2A00_05680 [Myxococcota bacterium]
MRMVWLLATGLALFLASQDVLAHPKVDAARKAYEEGEFAAALVHLDEAEADASLTEDDLVQAHWLRGASLHALRRKAPAEAAFHRLLALRPLYEPSELDASPELLGVFQDVANRWRAEHGVALGPPSVQAATMTVPVLKHVEQVAHVVAFARAVDQPAYQQFTLAVKDGTAQGVINSEELWEATAVSGALDVVVEARNARGTPLARLGSARQPLRLTVDAQQRAAALAAIQPTTPATTPPSGEEPITAPAPLEGGAPSSTEVRKGPSLRAVAWPLAGGLAGAGAAAVVVTLASAALSAGSYQGILAYPRRAGMETELPYRALLAVYVGGLGMTVVAAALALVLTTVGGVSAVGAFLLP